MNLLFVVLIHLNMILNDWIIQKIKTGSYVPDYLNFLRTKSINFSFERYQLVLEIKTMDNSNIQNIKNNKNAFNFLNETYEVMKW